MPLISKTVATAMKKAALPQHCQCCGTTASPEAFGTSPWSALCGALSKPDGQGIDAEPLVRGIVIALALEDMAQV